MPYKNPPPLFSTWCSMRYRCENPSVRNYVLYGARGIRVCKRWQKFNNFVADMGPRPPGTTLDRIDNDGNYEPGNCRWATPRKQSRNTRRTVFVTIEGKRYKAIELAEKFGVKPDTIMFRAKHGLTMAQIENPDAFPDRAGLPLAGAVSGRRRAARTHCKHGHEFNEQNTYYYKDGARLCRKCNSLKVTRYQTAKRAARRAKKETA